MTFRSGGCYAPHTTCVCVQILGHYRQPCRGDAEDSGLGVKEKQIVTDLAKTGAGGETSFMP